MKYLIERLRDAATKPNGWAILGAEAAIEAADALERLAAENAALRRDAERYRFIKRWVRRLDIVGYSLTCNEHFEPRIDEAMEQSHE